MHVSVLNVWDLQAQTLAITPWCGLCSGRMGPCTLVFSFSWLLWCSSQVKLKTVNTGRNSGTHGQNVTFCLQRALTVPKDLKYATKANFAFKHHNWQTIVWALPINHYTLNNKILNTALSANQCTIGCHCSPLLYVAFMPVPFVVKFAFLQRIGSRIRNALMQIVLIPLLLIFKLWLKTEIL